MKKQKSSSISRNLTYSLVLTVVVAATIIIGLGYSKASRKARLEMEKNARENILYITDSLEIPMWNLNYQSIENIGRSFSRNDLIVKLKIIDSSGKVLFSKEKESHGSAIKKNGEVVYNGKNMGNVEISLTPHNYKEDNIRLLW